MMMEWMRRGWGLLVVLMASHLPGGMGRGRSLNSTHEPSGFNDTVILINFLLQREQFRNPAVNPCEDFYRHVCDHAEVFDYPPTVMKRPKWKRLMEKELKGFIEEPISTRDEPVIVKVKAQYHMCMDNVSRDKDGVAVLKDMLNEFLNPWPMLMDNLGWSLEFMRLLKSQKYHPSLFSIRVKQFKIYIDQYDISAYGRYLSNLKLSPELEDRQKYKQKINKMLVMAGLKPKTYSMIFDVDLTDVLNFREDLHRIAAFQTSKQAREIQHVEMTVKQLQDLFNQVDQQDTFVHELKWLPFLRYVFEGVPDFEINNSTIVYVEENYMKNLITLMKIYGARPIVNHVLLHFFETYAGETTVKMRKISKAVAEAAQEASDLEEVNSCFNQPHIIQAANYLYLKKWYPEHSRNEAQTMIMNIKQALIDQIEDSRIFSNVTQKKTAQGEVHGVTVIIGSEPKYSKYNNMKDLYEYLVPSNHLGSLISAQRRFKRYEYSTIVKRKVSILDSIPTLQGDPFFSVEDSVINLPIGYLRRAGLSPTLSKIYSYATLGQEISLLLNEIVIKRGFEFQQLDFTKNWYGHKLTEEFQARTRCFQNQYRLDYGEELSRSMPLWASSISGNKALEYNIYDNAAFSTLYSAYSKDSDKLPDSDFLINWANGFCSYWNDYTDNKEQRWFNHLSPKSMRINKIMSNSAVFQHVFRCSSGSPMDDFRCKFWD